MGMKKKAKSKSMVWCYYCNKEFVNDGLLKHRREEHFKCHVCAKKFRSIGGMALHFLQKHKDVKANELPVTERVENKDTRNTKRARLDEPDGELIETEICEKEIIPPTMLASHSGNTKSARLDEPGGKLIETEICEREIIPPKMLASHSGNTKRARLDEPDGELIETEICEREIIPPKMLASHSGDQGEDSPSNFTKVGIPSSNLVGAIVAGAGGVGFPPESIVGAVQPIDDSELAGPPSGCPQPQVSLHPASLTDTPVGLQQQPSSPTLIIPLSSTICPALPPSFPINEPRVPSAHVSVACPKTGCLPPPVIRKKVRPALDNVHHFVWDDDTISMEEKRMAILKYQLSGVQ